MGCNFMSRSLSDSYTPPVVPRMIQPDPYNFKLIKEESSGNYVLAWVNYPDATNYEGNKILLIYGRNTVKDLKCLDPHFLEFSDVQVIARFQPSENGWLVGRTNLYSLSAMTTALTGVNK